MCVCVGLYYTLRLCEALPAAAAASFHVQFGQTALHTAAEHGHTNIIKYLLKEGKGDVDVTDWVCFSHCMSPTYPPFHS